MEDLVDRECIIQEYKNLYNEDILVNYGIVFGAKSKPNTKQLADFSAERESIEALGRLIEEPFLPDDDPPEEVVGSSAACEEFFQACDLDEDVSIILIITLPL